MHTAKCRLVTFVPAPTVIIASIQDPRLGAEDKTVTDGYQDWLIIRRVEITRTTIYSKCHPI